jgi:hypothetical protein
VHHWNGTTWLKVFGSGSANYTKAIWGTGTYNVWAVGSSQGSTGHYIGNGFGTISAPTAGAALRGIWGRSSSLIWAVGDLGQIDLWLGSAWTGCTAVTQLDLRSVAGGATKAWAVGSAGIVLVNQ